MNQHYIYKMDIVNNEQYHGSYIGQHKIGKKDPSCDGYKGSGIKWKNTILANHIPVKKTILKICNDIEETNYWEAYYIEQALQSGEFLWNVTKGGGGHESDKIYTVEEIKAHNKERSERWYKANKDHIAEYKKQYWKKNKEHLSSMKKKYKEEHKEFYLNYHRQYYIKNKETLSERNKQYYQEHKEEMAESKKKYYSQYKLTHIEQERIRHKKYHEEHKEERNKYYTQPCSYNGEIMTLRALILRFRRKNISKPTEKAKQYIIKEENNYELQYC